jgi:tripartite-type tricarboxylate transporter receptor subunit TctC
MKLFRFLFCVVGLILLSEGSAAEYPVRPIRFIVPQPPGGGTDWWPDSSRRV